LANRPWGGHKSA